MSEERYCLDKKTLEDLIVILASLRDFLERIRKIERDVERDIKKIDEIQTKILDMMKGVKK
jgi:deoxyadenosine/deoxycytidine kinase